MAVTESGECGSDDDQIRQLAVGARAGEVGAVDELRRMAVESRRAAGALVREWLKPRARAGDLAAVNELRDLAAIENYTAVRVLTEWLKPRVRAGDLAAVNELRGLSRGVEVRLRHDAADLLVMEWLKPRVRAGDLAAVNELRELAALDSWPAAGVLSVEWLEPRARTGDIEALAELRELAKRHKRAGTTLTRVLAVRAQRDPESRAELRDLANQYGDHAAGIFATFLAERALGEGGDLVLGELREFAQRHPKNATGPLASILRVRASGGDERSLAELRKLATKNNSASGVLSRWLGDRAIAGDEQAWEELHQIRFPSHRWNQVLRVHKERALSGDAISLDELRKLAGNSRQAAEALVRVLRVHAANSLGEALRELSDRATSGDQRSLDELRKLGDRRPEAADVWGRILSEASANGDALALEELRVLSSRYNSATHHLATALAARVRHGDDEALKELRGSAPGSYAGDQLVELLRDKALAGDQSALEELRLLAVRSAHGFDCLSEVLRPLVKVGDDQVLAELQEIAGRGPRPLDRLAIELRDRAVGGDPGALKELRVLATHRTQVGAAALAKALAEAARMGDEGSLKELRGWSLKHPQAAGSLALVLRDRVSRGDMAALRELAGLAERSVFAAVHYTKAIRRVSGSPASANSEPAVLEPGDAVGVRWRGQPIHIAELLRVGAGAVTYRACAKSDGREWAIKLTPLASVPNDWSEMEAYGELSHPNIANLSMIRLTDDDKLLIAVDFCAQGTLRDLLDRTNSDGLTIDAAVGIVRQIAKGLSYAHGQGVVHGDVKPSNIGMTESGATFVVKLLDFGASAHSPEGADEITLGGHRAGVVVGTPMYCAPEQSVGGLVEASDVYSLGCVFYELLTGRSVFQAGDPEFLFSQHRFAVPRRLGREGVPESIEGLVGRMLAKDPGDRPTAYEVERFIQGVGQASPGSGVWEWKLDAVSLFKSWVESSEWGSDE